MITAQLFTGQKIAILGLGISGIATARSLLAAQAEIIAWDDNPKVRENAKKYHIPIDHIENHNIESFAALILSPGIPLTFPKPHPIVEKAKENNVDIIGDTEIFCREITAINRNIKIIAVTGSNGKSTTVALITHILNHAGIRAQQGGNIGRPVLSLGPPISNGVYVIEFSSFQLELTPSLKPDIAILINISPDHLDRHGGLKNYIEAKKNIFRRQTKKNTAIIGTDDTYCKNITQDKNIKAKIIPVSYKNNHQIPIKNPALCGKHNRQNIQCAVKTAQIFGVDTRNISDALETFKGLPHRMEVVEKWKNITCINDSKATNADATQYALDAFKNIYWIAGGKPKKGGIKILIPYFKNVIHAFLIGEAAQEFAHIMKQNNLKYSIDKTLDKACGNAIRNAFKNTTENQNAIVLLSPACASFDQFDNFEMRGKYFTQYSQKIIDKIKQKNKI